MSTKTVKGRVSNKHKTEAEWLLDVYPNGDKTQNARTDAFIPLAGELIIYDPDSNYNDYRFKFGNGEDNVHVLPFGGAEKSHEHASNKVTKMTGYTKPATTSAITATDSLNTAIGKLEKALDGKSSLALGTTSTTAAAGNHLYHYWTDGAKYWDTYQGTNNLRIALDNVLGDTLRFQTPGGVEYYDYNTSTWTTWTKDLTPLFDGTSTSVAIPHANRKFRFLITATSGWPTSTLIVLKGGWYDGGTVTQETKVTIETRQATTNDWTEKVNQTFAHYTMGTNVYCTGNLHTGHTYYRITIEIGSWTKTTNNVPLTNFCILSNYNGYLRTTKYSASGDFVPITNNKYNLGTSSLAWKNVQAETFNGFTLGASVPSNAKFTDNNNNQTIKGNGTAFGADDPVNIVGGGDVSVAANATNKTITISYSTPSNNVTGSGTSGKLVKWNGTNTITDGPTIKSGGTGFLKEDGTWATPAGTYVLPLAKNGTRGGIQIGYSSTTKTHLPVALSSEKAYVVVTKDSVTTALGFTPISTDSTEFVRYPTVATSSTAGNYYIPGVDPANKALATYNQNVYFTASTGHLNTTTLGINKQATLEYNTAEGCLEFAFV